jgi:2'-hydroxyisoflavone reductase
MSLYRREFLKAVGAVAALSGCAASQNRSQRGSRPAVAPRRILILGGTGFIGPAIVGAARAAGHKLTLFNRGRSNPGLFPEVETIIGDRGTDLDRLRGRDWDAVIDTWSRFPSAVRAAAELLRERVPHYVFISTISVYKLGRDAIHEGSPLLHAEPPPPEDMDLRNYGPLKVLCEQAAMAAMPGRVTVVRPGVIAGPGDPTDRFTYWPVRMARGGDVLVPQGPDYRMQLIDVRDLAEWIVRAIEARHLGTYNAVGPEDPSLRSVLESVRGGVPGGSGARLIFVDGKWLEQNDVGGWGDFPLAVAGDSDSRGFAQVSAARALAKGLRFRSPADTAKDTLAWWQAQPEERRARKRPGLSPEREAELLRLWRDREKSPSKGA